MPLKSFHRRRLRFYTTTLFWVVVPSFTPLHAAEWSGNVSVELRAFPSEALYAEQHDVYTSLAVQPEFHHGWDNGKRGFNFTPFARFDQYDENRRHADLRELNVFIAEPSYEWRLGVRKVFWGVTESQHLVDIINQTDGVESPDGEEKLGQPMINVALIRPWGTVDVFVLTGFRERTFASPEGRPSLPLPVNTDDARYESDREWRHIDTALRYRHTIESIDIGLSYFNGTGREPTLIPVIRNGGPELVPYYEQIRQLGVDAQATLGGWLWKLEVIHRSGQGARYSAATGGFEYTFSGIVETGMDLGVITELLYDTRNDAAPTPFQRDVMIGGRLAVNDVQSSELLLGIIYDPDRSSRVYSVEGSRRIGDSWKISIEARDYAGIDGGDPLYIYRNDDYVQVELARHF